MQTFVSGSFDLTNKNSVNGREKETGERVSQESPSCKDRRKLVKESQAVEESLLSFVRRQCLLSKGSEFYLAAISIVALLKVRFTCSAFL